MEREKEEERKEIFERFFAPPERHQKRHESATPHVKKTHSILPNSPTLPNMTTEEPTPLQIYHISRRNPRNSHQNDWSA